MDNWADKWADKWVQRYGEKGSDLLSRALVVKQ